MLIGNHLDFSAVDSSLMWLEGAQISSLVDESSKCGLLSLFAFVCGPYANADIRAEHDSLFATVSSEVVAGLGLDPTQEPRLLGVIIAYSFYDIMRVVDFFDLVDNPMLAVA